jgi:hypothetical protein
MNKKQKKDYADYNIWIANHLHCDTGTWGCPDENDCPHNLNNYKHLHNQMDKNEKILNQIKGNKDV